MIETGFKNSQNQNFKLYKNRGVLLLGYAPLLGIIRYLKCLPNVFIKMLAMFWLQSIKYVQAWASIRAALEGSEFYVKVWKFLFSLAVCLVVVCSLQQIWVSLPTLGEGAAQAGLGVHNRLHIYPLCGAFYLPWHSKNTRCEAPPSFMVPLR